METQTEYERGAMGSTHTAVQRTTFDDIVRDWLSGTVPLAEAASALRVAIAKLPVKPTPANRRSKSESVPQAEPPATSARVITAPVA